MPVAAVDDLRKIAALPEEGRKAMATWESSSERPSRSDQRGHYAEAERIYRTVLEIRRKWLGDGHPHTATSYNNVAGNLNEQGKYAEAEPLYRKALAIRLKALGEDHPDTAAKLQQPRVNLDVQGKYAEAETLYRQALAIRLEALGEDHPDTARSYNNLAANLDEQGKYAEAEAALPQGPGHPAQDAGGGPPRSPPPATTTSRQPAMVKGKYAEAEPLFRKALAIRLKALGEDHPDTARSYNNLAATLLRQGKYAEAEAL